MLSVEWPGPLPDLADLPALEVVVRTPRDQAWLHRHLARLGYTAMLEASDPTADRWTFTHPDGEQP